MRIARHLVRDLLICGILVAAIVRAIVAVDAHHRGERLEPPRAADRIAFSQRYAPAVALELRDAALAPPVPELAR